MKADITRDTFDAAKHYSRVMMQQGRVTLDADWNEQASILLYTLRKMANDIIGPFSGPANNCGFQISSSGPGNLALSGGRYYVDGIMVENDGTCQYMNQPYLTPGSTDPIAIELGLKSPSNQVFWMYLDVWEWHLTFLSDGNIREVALGGPDTCTRTAVVWQVKCVPFDGMVRGEEGKTDGTFIESSPQSCQRPLGGLMSTSTGRMTARVDPGQPVDSPCIMPPSAKYRGAENQLYRVEVHIGGDASTATFKWSRDNGSIATSLVSQSGNVLTVNQARNFAAGNWIELLDDNFELNSQPGALVKLAQAGNGALTVDPSSLPTGVTLDKIYAGLDQGANPRAIRWDQTDTDDAPLTNGAVPIVESINTAQVWINLEDGVQVAFTKVVGTELDASQYRTGDYWLIPARVATGDIEWPTFTDASSSTQAIPMPPNGVEHHYAPLGYVSWSGGTFQLSACSCTFEPTAMCPGANGNQPEVRITGDNPEAFDAFEKTEVKIERVKRASKPAGAK